MTVNKIKAQLENRYDFVDEYFKSLNKKDNDEFTFKELMSKKADLSNTYNKNKFKNFLGDLSEILLQDQFENFDILKNFKVIHKKSYGNNKKINLKVRFGPIINKKDKVNKKIKKKKNNKKKNKKIKKKKVKIKKKDNLEKLYKATCANKVYEVKRLLRNKVNPNKRFDGNEYPIIVAAEKGYLEILDLLLNFNADPKLRDILDNFDALLTAVYCDKYEVVEILLNHNKELLNTKLIDCNRNPLHLASFYGHKETLNVLLNYYKNYFEKSDLLNHIDIKGNTAINLACSKNKYEIFELLLNEGADINISDNILISPLHNSIINKNLKMIKLCLNKNAEVNKLDKLNNTPLHYGINQGKEIIEILLKYGANPFAINNKDENPIDLFQEDETDMSKEELLKLIFEFKKAKGNTIIHELATGGLKILQYIFSLYPDINILIKNENNENPFDIAIKYFELDILIELLEYIANSELINEDDIIINLENYFMDLKEEQIKILNEEVQLKIKKLSEDKQILRNQKKEEFNEFEYFLLESKIINEYLYFLENILLKINIKNFYEEETIEIILKNDCLSTLKFIDKKISPIIKNIESKNNILFIVNKSLNPKKYIDFLKLISYFWEIKADIKFNLAKHLKIEIIKPILNDYQKSIKYMEESLSYANKYNLQNINKLKFKLSEIIIKKLECLNSLNKNDILLLNKVDNYIENWRSNYLNSNNPSKSDLLWYKLNLRFNQLKNDSQILLKNYFTLYNNANRLFYQGNLNKADYIKYTYDFLKLGHFYLNEYLLAIEECILDDAQYTNTSSKIYSVFNLLFQAYFDLNDFDECIELCNSLKEYQSIIKQNIN